MKVLLVVTCYLKKMVTIIIKIIRWPLKLMRQQKQLLKMKPYKVNTILITPTGFAHIRRFITEPVLFKVLSVNKLDKYTKLIPLVEGAKEITLPPRDLQCFFVPLENFLTGLNDKVTKSINTGDIVVVDDYTSVILHNRKAITDNLYHNYLYRHEKRIEFRYPLIKVIDNLTTGKVISINSIEYKEGKVLNVSALVMLDNGYEVYIPIELLSKLSDKKQELDNLNGKMFKSLEGFKFYNLTKDYIFVYNQGKVEVTSEDCQIVFSFDYLTFKSNFQCIT